MIATPEQIEGMIILLNKLIWKSLYPDCVLSEANGVIGLEGRFVFTGKEIIYVRR